MTVIQINIIRDDLCRNSRKFSVSKSKKLSINHKKGRDAKLSTGWNSIHILVPSKLIKLIRHPLVRRTRMRRATLLLYSLHCFPSSLLTQKLLQSSSSPCLILSAHRHSPLFSMRLPFKCMHWSGQQRVHGPLRRKILKGPIATKVWIKNNFPPKLMQYVSAYRHF